MGFGLQLRLLLWKNFTLKKRSPLAVLFEVLIPLVLFLILMGIRLRRQPQPKPEEIFPVRALPSSGIIPLLQQFCPNKVTDEHGFPLHPNSSIGSILADISDIMNSPSLSVLDNLKNIPQLYQKFKGDYSSFQDNLKDFTLQDVIFNSTEVHELLKNLSIPLSISDGILNSTVSGSEISNLLQASQPGSLHTTLNKNTGVLTLLASLLRMQSIFKSPSHNMNFTAQKNKFNISQQGCNSNEFTKGVLLSDHPSKKSVLNSLCNLSPIQASQIRKVLVSHLSTNKLMTKLNVTQHDLKTFNESFRRLSLDIKNLSTFVELVEKGQHMASILQLNMTFAEGMQNKSDKERNRAYIQGMWKNLGPILCGSGPEEQPDKVVEHMFDYRCLTKSCKTRALRLMFYLLTHNPKILYAPNNTAADDVITEANRTFSDIEALQNIVKVWLNQSAQIRSVLLDNNTQYYLHIMADAIKNYPDVFFEVTSNITNQDPSSASRYYRDIHELLTGEHGVASPVVEQLDRIDAVAKMWLMQTSNLQLNIFVGFKDEASLVSYAFNNTGTRPQDSKIVAGIVFTNIKANQSLPPHVNYKIRMNATYFTPPTDRIRDNYWRPGPQSWGQSYYDLGFVWLQDQIERAIVNFHSGREVIKPAVYLHEMPYPCYAKDRFMFVIQHMMPLCMTVSWIYTVAIVVRSIVYEKEQRLKEVMKMMGLSNVVHWVAWFITSMSVMSVTVLLLTIILKYGKVLAYSDPLIIWLSLMLFAIVTIVFCFLISSFFSKAKLAAACGGIIYFLTYMPYVFISIREGAGHVSINIPEKMAASLLSTSAFGLGARYFALYEEQGEGVQWSNIGQSPVKGDEFTLLKVLYFLVFDTFLYVILVWYIEAVHPGSYGLPRPWYFPFQLTYWFGHNTKVCSRFGRKDYSRMTDNELEEAPRTPGLLAYESEPIHLPLGVTVDHLEKVYKSGIKAVDGLALNLYEGQITSFLGHNGAGKTTTMSILTGLFPPTDGTAFIYGYDIRFDMDVIRRNLGMCPQHNVLFDRLTVDEHLWFYARMKGLPTTMVKKEMDQLVEDVGLPNKRNCAVETLSGGMKRKLSVAMAFVGGSRTVILDEPTAGVDPYARRAIWDLLIKYKKGRTILLSTHFMEEADILGDRIAIISSGKLRCVGSPLFLKSRFGEGYNLTLVRKQDRSPRGSSSDLATMETRASSTSLSSMKSRTNVLSPGSENQEEKLTSFITSHIPAAQIKNITQQEFTYILPDNSVEKGGFEKLFTDLESNTEALGIDSYGITDTSLEEVFLKVTDVTTADSGDDSLTSQESFTSPAAQTLSFMDREDCLELNDYSTNNDREHLLTVSHSEEDVNCSRPANVANIVPSGVGSYTLTRSALKWQQFYALILKRFHHARRNFKGVISQILLPALFISIAMTMALSLPPLPDLPPLQLSPSMFPRRNFIPFGNEAKGMNPLAKRMEQTLTLPSGVGATCCLQSSKYSLKNHTRLTKDQLANLFDESCREAIDDVSSVYLKPTNEKFSYIYYSNSSINISESVTHQDTGPGCKCSANGTWYLCSKGAAGKRPDELVTITLDTLQNVTGRNMSKYLLYTTQAFRRHRYGGLSFGNVVKFVPQKFEKVPVASVRRLAVREAVKSWYNNKGYHALPTYLNVMNNAILRASLDKRIENPSIYGISVYNHPFPFNSTSNTHLSADYLRQGTDLVIAIFVIIAMSFVPASFVVFLVTERSSKAKHLQFVSGVDPVIYWLANYLWDMEVWLLNIKRKFEENCGIRAIFRIRGAISEMSRKVCKIPIRPAKGTTKRILVEECNYLIPAAACVTLLYLFSVPAYASPTNYPAVVGLFMLYGWSITPMMYPSAFCFNEASSAYVAMIVLNLFVGITATVTTFILQLFPDDEVLTNINSILKDVSLGFPNYCLGRGLMDLAYNQYMTEYYTQIGENERIRSPFEWMIVSRNLVCMFFEGIVFFIFTILIEYRFFLRPRRIPVSKIPIQAEDEDVADERCRVLRGDADTDLVRIENLTKVYYSRKRGKHLAVDRLCLGIPQGECFGLLGVNGAGKTSTFKMLTGDTSMTAGDAVLNSYRISTDILKVYRCIGYCPQFDALIDEMTAEEQIYLYARLRGVPEKELKQVTAWAVKKLGLSCYAKYPCKSYSGGNKRKLSTAIALIGNPPIIFLDEPTTGMDPRARRFLWNLILNIVKDGRSVVLTSHSMEECEALCSRLAIMVNGQFTCLGSCQHLKNRFGEGYIVTVRIQGDIPDLRPAIEYFNERLPCATLKERHHNMLQYQIPSGVVSLAKIFGSIESYQDQLHIEDYSISQTTLDNVFINFARQQKDETDFNEPSLSSSRQSRGTGHLPPSLTTDEIRFSMLQDDDDDSCHDTFDGMSRLEFNDQPPKA